MGWSKVFGCLMVTCMAGWLEVRTCAAGGGHHGTGTVEKIPFRITMEELHKQGGVPQGWKFTFPIGDFQDGRKVFVALECYQCHRVAGETFPKSNKEDIEKKGPDLTGMGDHHPIEYFAESIIHPNAVIVIGDGYTTSEGFSVMPEYGESLTLKQLIDLVTYLKKLTLQDAHPYNH